MSLLPFAPRTDCSVPRCGCNGQPTARVVPLCLCRANPRAECPAHPAREVPSRAQLLTVAVACLVLAALVLAMWMRANALDLAVLR